MALPPRPTVVWAQAARIDINLLISNTFRIWKIVGIKNFRGKIASSIAEIFH